MNANDIAYTDATAEARRQYTGRSQEQLRKDLASVREQIRFDGPRHNLVAAAEVIHDLLATK